MARAAIRQDPSRTGVVIAAAPVHPLPRAWRRACLHRQQSAPVIARGLVVFGGRDSRLRAIDIVSAAECWTAILGGATSCSPVIEGPSALIGGDDGIFRAVDLSTGSPSWQVDLGDAIACAAVAEEGIVHVGAGGVRTETGPGAVFALDLVDGSLRWKRTTERGCSGALTRAGDVVLAVTREGRIACLDAATGADRWAVKPGGDVAVSAAVRGRTAVVVMAGGVCACDIGSGEMLWAFEAGSFGPGATAAVTREAAYIGVREGLVALDLETGMLWWTVERLRLRGSGSFGDAVVVGDTVIAPCSDGHLYGLEASTGNERWRIGLPEDGTWTSPHVAAGHLVLANVQEPAIYCFRLAG
jgi:outer membrane protein assembly factor BamB